MSRWRVFCVLFLLACDVDGLEVDAGLWRDASAGARDAGAGERDAAPADAQPGELDGGGSPPCEAFVEGVVGGTVASPALDELSGLASSRRHAGLLYANNDSGDSARIFLLGEDGAHRGTVTLEGADHVDYEDLAVGPGPDGASWVHVGDTGDNAARTGIGAPRAEVQLYRFPEPAALPGPGDALSVTPEVVTLTYPDGPRDCESVAVDPASGDLYLLSKHDTGPSTLYVARAPFAGRVALAEVATVTLAPGSASATAMDLSAGGRGLLVRTYNRVHLFVRAVDEDSWAPALGRAPLLLPVRSEGQGEAIAWRADGRGYFTASEGAVRPLYFFAASTDACVPL